MEPINNETNEEQNKEEEKFPSSFHALDNIYASLEQQTKVDPNLNDEKKQERLKIVKKLRENVRGKQEQVKKIPEASNLPDDQYTMFPLGELEVNTAANSDNSPIDAVHADGIGTIRAVLDALGLPSNVFIDEEIESKMGGDMVIRDSAPGEWDGGWDIDHDRPDYHQEYTTGRNIPTKVPGIVAKIERIQERDHRTGKPFKISAETVLGIYPSGKVLKEAVMAPALPPISENSNKG